jgi:glycosyltransferase involved in cell wall biosynthesis
LLKKEQADLCIIRRASFIGLLLKADINFIYEAHNSLAHEGSKILNFLWSKYLLKKSHKNCFVKMVAISKALGDYLKAQGVPQDKIFVSHDGFNHKMFSKKKDISQAKRQIGISEKQKTAIYAGSLYPDRGIERIIKLAECFKDVLFIVIGGPEKEKKHYVEIARLKNIQNILFKGWVPHYQVPDYLSASDICIMIWTKKVKTIQYCSPMKMFEYMASGQLIIGDGFPTIKEVLENGRTALLTVPESISDLRDKFQMALDNNFFGNISQNARSLALQHYSWDKRAKLILDQL